MQMKRLFYIGFLLLTTTNLVAQDVHFSQFYANPIYLSPSFAGGAAAPRAIVNVRDQWAKIPGTYLSYSFTADNYFANYNSGLGIFMVGDNAGDGKLVTTIAGLAYSYKVKISRDFIFQPGISAYYYNRHIDYTQISFADQFFQDQYLGASSEVLPDERVQHADFALSGLGYFQNSWFGFTVDHLMNISPELRRDTRYTNMKVSLYGGYKYELAQRTRNKRDEFLHFAFNYFYQSQAHQLDIGFYYNRLPFVLGLWYRGIPVGNEYFSADALILLAGLKRNNMTFSYSYDMTLGKLISQTGGSHEFSIIYTMQPISAKKKRYKAIPCPEF